MLALAAVAAGGHSSSARLSGVAFTADLVHLIAASVWLGGIAMIAIAWVPRLRGLGAAGRRRIVEVVLPRFGAVALPAFLALVVAGGLNAATELGSARALWSTAYGRVLLAKTALVCVVAALSYAHALRLRPRLLAAARGYDAALERRHWRLLATEPILGIGIVVAAALLLAYAPPIDLAEQVAAVGSGPAPTVVRDASAVGAQLSVAAEAGPDIVNALVSPGRGGVSVEVRTLDALEQPVALPVRVSGSDGRRSVRRRLHPGGARGVAGRAGGLGRSARPRVSRVAAGPLRAGRWRGSRGSCWRRSSALPGDSGRSRSTRRSGAGRARPRSPPTRSRRPIGSRIGCPMTGGS